MVARCEPPDCTMVASLHSFVPVLLFCCVIVALCRVPDWLTLAVLLLELKFCVIDALLLLSACVIDALLKLTARVWLIVAVWLWPLWSICALARCMNCWLMVALWSAPVWLTAAVLLFPESCLMVAFERNERPV